ncbi:HEPN domain-containing protein [Candidatus Nanohalococcus occultus]|uniref:HEPN domain-containing protein n=1 Tax=Candidatus Nanohalococcus occultus TaxID=2978047 RepID=UPI0039E114F1
MRQSDELLNEAEEVFSEAKYLFEGGKVKGTISRSYYAAFNAVKAMLLTKDSKPKTHQGVASEFGRLFREEVGSKLTRDYSELQRMREQADYGSGEQFDEEDAQFAIDISEEIIENAKNVVK